MAARATRKKKTGARKKKAKRGRGRPSDISRDFIAAFCALIEEGNGVKAAAAFLGFPRSTVYEWIQRGAEEKLKGKRTLRADLADAFARAEAGAEISFVQSVRQAAMGYEKVIEVTEIQHLKDGTKIEKVKRQTVLERDPKMALEWLRRRRREEWGDNEKVELKADVKSEVKATIDDHDVRARLLDSLRNDAFRN